MIKRTDQRSGDPSPAPRKRCPPEHDRRNGIKLIGKSSGRLRAFKPRGQHDAGKGRQRTGQRIDNDLHPCDIDTGQLGDLFIATDCIDIASDPGVVECIPAGNKDNEGEYDGDRNPGNIAPANLIEAFRDIEITGRDRTPVGENERGAPEHGHADQRGDKGLNPKETHDRALCSTH